MLHHNLDLSSDPGSVTSCDNSNTNMFGLQHGETNSKGIFRQQQSILQRLKCYSCQEDTKM